MPYVRSAMVQAIIHNYLMRVDCRRCHRCHRRVRLPLVGVQRSRRRRDHRVCRSTRLQGGALIGLSLQPAQPCPVGCLVIGEGILEYALAICLCLMGVLLVGTSGSGRGGRGLSMAGSGWSPVFYCPHIFCCCRICAHIHTPKQLYLSLFYVGYSKMEPQIQL